MKYMGYCHSFNVNYHKIYIYIFNILLYSRSTGHKCINRILEVIYTLDCVNIVFVQLKF